MEIFDFLSQLLLSPLNVMFTTHHNDISDSNSVALINYVEKQTKLM